MTSGEAAQRRVLVVMRHAQAAAAASTDSERPLTDTGVARAGEAGAWLAGLGVVPDVALVSAAVRTQQTWQHVAGAAGWDVEPTVDRGLYAADTDSALDLVRVVPDDTGTVLLLGHNPTVGVLGQLLDDGSGDGDAETLLASGMPPGTAAVFDVPVPWVEVAEATLPLRAAFVRHGG